MDRESACVLLAWKETVRSENGTGAFQHVYSRIQVLDAPADLPDGEYQVAFGHQQLQVTRRRGLWLSNWNDKQETGRSDVA
ncbi:MAG TPA: hypothetical protein VMD25_09790 [Acidobacteriaceae bacterium]|nr:hypothetical protein [Acidobacteriaceae bacterium]